MVYPFYGTMAFSFNNQEKEATLDVLIIQIHVQGWTCFIKIQEPSTSVKHSGFLWQGETAILKQSIHLCSYPFLQLKKGHIAQWAS